MIVDPVDRISRICDDADGDKLTRIAAVLGYVECRHQWGNFQTWNDASGEHGSKRCVLCGRYVQW